MSLNLVVGYGGLVSLCHAAFFGIAGYVLALASPKYDPASLWWTLPLAVAASAAAAAVIGSLALRTRGIYFIMVTLAFGEMLFFLFHDSKFAGGSDGAFIYNKPSMMLGNITLLDLENPGLLLRGAGRAGRGDCAFDHDRAFAVRSCAGGSPRQ